MTKKEILRLILDPEVFSHLSYLLISLDLVTIPNKEEPSITRLVLTKKGKEILKSKTLSIDAAYVRKYRSLFPVGKKGDANLTAQNLGWLFANHDVTSEQILKATELYLGTVDDMKYCQQADLFIYKTLPGGAVRNTILTFLDDLETGETNTDEEGYGCQIV
jgi:hypothetical protein